MSAALLSLFLSAMPGEDLVVGAVALVREPRVPLRVKEKTVGYATLGQPFKVSVLEGAWVGLSGQGSPFGFVERKSVVGLDQAVDVFSAELIKNPKDAAGWLARGTARRLRGELDEAAKDLDEAVRLAPTADARIARGNLRRERGDAAAALADYDAALRIAPKSPFARNNRGEVFADQGNWAGALAEYDAALKELPTFGLAMVNRGVARAKRQDHAGAVADYNAALALNPLDAAALNAGAWLLATCPDGRFRHGKRAVEMAQRASGLANGKDWNALDTLAAAHAEAGDFPAALAAHAKARELAPDDMKPQLDPHGAKIKAKQPVRD